MSECIPVVAERRGPAVLSNTRADYPRDATIHALFEEQARLRPDAVALVCGGETLTYGELDCRANRLANHLGELGAGPEILVGVCLQRSVDLVVALLAILKAGGAYVPFDPGYPRERLEFMLADSRAAILVTEEKLRSELLHDLPGVRVITLPSSFEGNSNTAAPAGKANARSLAYVMYTSGSTGQPKGVQVEHRSVVRLVKGNSYCEFGPQEVILQFAPASFDASTFEIWGALLNGGRLVIVPEQTPSLEELGRTVREHRVTTLWLTAGLFHLMVEQRIEDLRGVKQLLAGGDVLSAPHVRTLLEAAQGCTVINGYGPTENTTFTCCHVMRAGDSVPDSVPIGRPIANTQVYIVDDFGTPVSAGEPGELWAGGDGLARGYLNRPELTRERFIQNPFSKESGERLYRTGDRVRCRPDGAIEFLGRLDNQVKISGFRIELGEIETVLQQHPALQQVAVVARSEGPGEKRLVAYVVPRPHCEVVASQLRDYLHNKLPQYMVPAIYVALPGLPLSANGKVDRAALPAPSPALSEPATDSGQLEGLEAAVAEIWRKVLGNSAVGLDDNFFDLGGDSLMLMEAHAQLQKTVPNFDLSVVDLFEFATIRSLVKHLGSVVPRKPAFSEAEARAEKQRQALASRRQRFVEQHS